jgi:hypothetical protein
LSVVSTVAPKVEMMVVLKVDRLAGMMAAMMAALRVE